MLSKMIVGIVRVVAKVVFSIYDYLGYLRRRRRYLDGRLANSTEGHLLPVWHHRAASSTIRFVEDIAVRNDSEAAATSFRTGTVLMSSTMTSHTMVIYHI
ncbi:hypothetical protein BJX66DRAFT_62045 [Aspergillus keveii]|uniref:Uncharacterized protein n=1 Tax=Aspergillus keveii TaxID=714993 RepID=A0ABR4GG41_9EURO